MVPRAAARRLLRNLHILVFSSHMDSIHRYLSICSRYILMHIFSGLIPPIHVFGFPDPSITGLYLILTLRIALLTWIVGLSSHAIDCYFILLN